jgi:enoyl-CoA hydratase/carnithine racemase
MAKPTGGGYPGRMTEHIRTALSDGVLSLTLARPEKKNAITDAMYAAMADAVERTGSDPAVRVLLIDAVGDTFSAGNDLVDFLAQNQAGRTGGEMHVMRFLRALAAAEKPVVAAVTGQAVGIGVTMLLHCDLVYVAKDARLSTPFVNLAVVPEAASSLLLPAAIGHQRAFAMFALGEVVSGEDAAAWGLANEALDAPLVYERARTSAEKLARAPAGSLAITKRLMRDADVLTQRMDAESRHFGERLTSAEAREALQAFFEKRRPDFTKAG